MIKPSSCFAAWSNWKWRRDRNIPSYERTEWSVNRAVAYLENYSQKRLREFQQLPLSIRLNFHELACYYGRVL